MNILFIDEKIKKLVLTPKFQKEHGANAFKELQKLLLKLKAANSMHEFWPEYSGKERCHELKNKKRRDLRGHFSLSIIGSLRLIVSPEQEWIDSDPSTRRWADIHAVTIIYAGDYHDD